MTEVLTSNSFIGVDGDERIVAKAALDAAEEQLRSLCASHAGTFVSVERRGAALEASLKELLAAVVRAEEKVVTAKHALEQDEDSETSLAALSEKHRVRRRTLLQHSSLLELLELPSLMDACVRSNLYEEALNIAAFANTLERRHTEKNEVVLKVIAQVRSRQSDLRRHLLHCLKNQVTMPECLEIITALRRLNSIDLERQSETNLERVHAAMELTLQIDFLEARDAWLHQASAPGTLPGLGGISNKVNASEQLLDAIERYRTRMFEIATQFNAIFRAQTNAQKISVSLLSMWTSRRVQSFLIMLKGELRHMEDSAALRDALDACVFFSASMGRLGADFTSLLPPLFEEKMHFLVVHYWKEGVNQLNETLKICREAGVASPLSSSAAVPPTLTSQGSDVGDSDAGPMPPPRQLMAMPPLGRLVNAFLTGLNELRRCLLPGIFNQLRASLEEILAEIDVSLQSNERTVMTPGLRGEAVELRAKAKEMREAMANIVVPYVRGALELSLGNEAGARVHHQALMDFLKPPLEVTEEKPVEDGSEEKEEEEKGDEPPPPATEEESEPNHGDETSKEYTGNNEDEAPAVADGEGWNDDMDAMDDFPDETEAVP